ARPAAAGARTSDAAQPRAPAAAGSGTGALQRRIRGRHLRQAPASGAVDPGRARRWRAVRPPLRRPRMTLAPGGFAVVTPGSRFEEIVDRLPAPVGRKFAVLEAQHTALYGALTAAIAGWQDARQHLVRAQGAAAAAQDGDRRDVDRLNRARQS